VNASNDLTFNFIFNCILLVFLFVFLLKLGANIHEEKKERFGRESGCRLSDTLQKVAE